MYTSAQATIPDLQIFNHMLNVTCGRDDLVKLLVKYGANIEDTNMV